MLNENMNGKGCLEGKKDIRDYRLKKGIAMAVAYPQEYRCPKEIEIKNQGSICSCVAHSAAEILEYHSQYPIRLSTNFIYGIHKKLFNSNGPGMYLREACKIIQTYGDPTYMSCPGNFEVEKVYDIANQAFENKIIMDESYKYRISKYIKIKSVNEIKYALTNYGPVMAAVDWYDDNTVDKVTGYLTQGHVNPGGHAIIIIGWNEKGWLCQNSWGKYWGNNGYFILPWSYKIKESYSFIPKGNEQDIVVPCSSPLINLIYKAINSILNIFA